MSRNVRALTILALLVLSLAGPVAAATASQVSGTSLWGSGWQWLVELLLPEDPDGGETPPDPGSDGGDAGGGIDPNGVKVFGVTFEPRTVGGPAVR